MLKNIAGNGGATRVADVAFAASRQVWLAGLGAATMTRQWARNDAGEAFRILVKEGSTVEARARRGGQRRARRAAASVRPSAAVMRPRPGPRRGSGVS